LAALFRASSKIPSWRTDAASDGGRMIRFCLLRLPDEKGLPTL